MIKFSISIFLLFVSLSIIAQKVNYDKIDSNGVNGYQIQYRTAIILVKTIKGKDTINSAGVGFILKNKYVATCYHVYKKDTGRVIEIKVLYNVISKDSFHYGLPTLKDWKYDSTFATLDYKVKKHQYNFKAHNFIIGNPETDFIILKLDKKIKSILPNFDTIFNYKNEQMFLSSGYSLIWDLAPKFESSKQDILFQILLPNSFMYFTTGYSREGYSGSPCFNKKGEIVAVTQMGVKKEFVKEYLNYCTKNGMINERKSKEILSEMNASKEVGFGLSIGINYFIKRYMAGYF